MYTVKAFQVSSSVNLRLMKLQLNWNLLFQDSDELYFEIGEYKYVYVFQYGMISFFNVSDVDIERAISKLSSYFVEPLTEKHSEEIVIEIQAKTLQVHFDKVILPELHSETIRLVMLNASQSVALARFSEITELLLAETNEHTKFLERRGKLDISGGKLKRFIGKTLNIKNKISENLYIFDSPDIAWEDESLNKLNNDLKSSFDLKDRYRVIHDRIDIIKENLELFKDIMDHRESSRLEWIIIILILVEVLDMFALKII